MRTARMLAVAALVAAPLFALATPASAVCYYDLEGQQVCGGPCWPLEGYVADPVGTHCVH